MKKLFLLYILMFQTSLILSDEYRYPVENLDDETILMMHQNSLDNLELLSYNIKTDEYQKLLSSLYLPAYVKIIPGKKRYSFIDRGRVYVKDFLKRTPRVLDIYQPIYDIQSLLWINDHECIFSAKYKNKFKLFMYDIDKDGGTLYTLSDLHDTKNYIFPSFSNGEIFCLVRQIDSENCEMVKIVEAAISFDEAVQNEYQKKFTETVFDFDKSSLCFLQMKNNKIGYVLEIIKYDLSNKILTFASSRIELEKNNVTIKELFTFDIPEKFIMGIQSDRLFESMNPLLPLYNENEIYFTTYDQVSSKLKLFVYNQETQEISLYPAVKGLENKHVFAPYLVNNHLYFGQSHI